jgi:hypothetical protein
MRNSKQTIIIGIVMMITGIYLDTMLKTLYYMTSQSLPSGPPILATPELTFIFPLGLAIMLAGVLTNQGFDVNAQRFAILYLLSFLLLLLIITLLGPILLF